MSILLQAVKIKKIYKQAKKEIFVLQNISVCFKKNESYAIMGSSGSGKSTLLHILASLEKPCAGDLLFNGKNIHDASQIQKDQFLNKNIGLVFQSPYLIKEITVIENVMLKGQIAGYNIDFCKEQAYQLLKAVGIEDKITAYPAQLSGGQAQRVAVARALFNKPDFLLADEPTGNLDQNTGFGLIELLLQLQKEWDMGLIISTHDPAVAQKMTSILELKNGLLIKK